jgi:uncharacterized protein YcbK (DUF882 family)
MPDLTEHFSRREFACPDGCGRDTADVELLRVLERLRRAFGAPVIVTSGHRCPEHNAAVGGAPDSQHLYGRAADIQVEDATPDEVYRYLTERYPTRYGIGRYDGWTHVDTRSGPPARW